MSGKEIILCIYIYFFSFFFSFKSLNKLVTVIAGGGRGMGDRAKVAVFQKGRGVSCLHTFCFEECYEGYLLRRKTPCGADP